MGNRRLREISNMLDNYLNIKSGAGIKGSKYMIVLGVISLVLFILFLTNNGAFLPGILVLLIFMLVAFYVRRDRLKLRRK